MTLPRELVARIRRLDEHQLRRLAILVRGLLQTGEGPHLEPSDMEGMPAVRYRQRHVRCGKDCASCPHGPYWYASWKQGGRSHTAYVGRELPPDVRRLLERSGDTAQVQKVAHPVEPGSVVDRAAD